MAGLRVLVNGGQVAAVSNAELNLISLYLHGNVFSEELAFLELTGGNTGAVEEDTHWTWINAQEISEGDVVEVIFVKDINSSHTGKTLEELHPEPAEREQPIQSADAMIDELSSRPKKRDIHELELTLPDGDIQVVATNPGDFSFGFSVSWKWVKPEEASVRLTSNPLEGVRNRQNGSCHAKFLLKYGDSVKVRICSQ